MKGSMTLTQQNNKRLIQSSLLSLLLGFSLVCSGSIASSAHAAAPSKAATCAACHGQDGGKTLMPNYPKIKGQNKAYITAVLKEYKAGTRKGGNAAIMNAQASSLSNADIEALADYYSKQ